VNCSQEVPGGFVVARGDTSEDFEFSEEILYQVAGFVEFFIVFPLHLSVGFWRYDGLFTSLLQRFEYSLVGVEAFVGDHRVGFQLRQQDICSVQITGLTFAEMEPKRVAKRIDCGVDLGA